MLHQKGGSYKEQRKRELVMCSGWQQFSLTSTGAELKLQPHKYIERN